MAKTPPSRSYRLFSAMGYLPGDGSKGTLRFPVRFSYACSLRRSRSAAQLDVGNRLASKGLAERYEGLWRSPLKPTTSATGRCCRKMPCCLGLLFGGTFSAYSWLGIAA